MDHPNKKQKVDSIATYKDEVLFNSDTLSKVISFLPSTDLLNLALTCKKFGISSEDDKLSLIEESARLMVQEIATEEELITLPYYNGENSLANYHYLQFMRGPLGFDQLVDTKYVRQHYLGRRAKNQKDKSCVANSGNGWGTAFSNNILRAGKHYVSFVFNNSSSSSSAKGYVGVMRPGKANQNASGVPYYEQFFQNFSPNVEYNNNDNKVQCCLYRTVDGKCLSCDWANESSFSILNWDGLESGWQGRESIPSGLEIALLLDLDEGTLSVYKNGRKLGVMKRGLMGPYSWVVSMNERMQVTMRRGEIVEVEGKMWRWMEGS